jgi:hypothetical protein
MQNQLELIEGKEKNIKIGKKRKIMAKAIDMK